MKRQQIAACLLAVVTLVGASGCTGLPEGGPVVETRVDSSRDAERPMSIDPAPPRPGASAPDIAAGFLDAMEASPVRVDVARQFLSAGAQSTWDPERSTIVHDGLGSPDVIGGTVSVSMTDPDRLDRRGAWQGVLPPSQQALQFEMVEENGEIRIADPIDALIVSATWFESRYEQVSLYFFDRNAEFLVPEPIFVPRGEQMATSLIDALLVGPPADLGASGRTFVPSRLGVGLSVPVSRDGVADIALVGESVLPDAETVERMLAQFAWTLRQEPSITTFTITIGGQDVRLPGGVTEFPVSGAGRYDPTGYQSSSLLFGVQDGLVVSGSPEDLAAVSGPFGQQVLGLESMAVNPDGSTIAGVTGAGASVLVGPVAQTVGTGAKTVKEVLSGAVDLLPPAYDLADRLWLVDQTANGAEISYLVDDRPVPIEIPGITHRQVRHFLVSRDATRFVAVVRSKGIDEVRVSRLRTSENGKILRATPSRSLVFDGSERLRVVDLGWSTPTSIALLSPITGDLFEALTVAVDGAPTGLEMRSSSVNGPARELVGSPASNTVGYVRTEEGLVEVGRPILMPLDPGVSIVQYVG